MTRERGRPPISPEERAERIRDYKKTVRNVTMDADVAAKIGMYRDKLSEKVGFEVTISQALAHALRNVEFKDDD